MALYTMVGYATSMVGYVGGNTCYLLLGDAICSWLYTGLMLTIGLAVLYALWWVTSFAFLLRRVAWLVKCTYALACCMWNVARALLTCKFQAVPPKECATTHYISPTGAREVIDSSLSSSTDSVPSYLTRTHMAEMGHGILETPHALPLVPLDRGSTTAVLNTPVDVPHINGDTLHSVPTVQTNVYDYPAGVRLSDAEVKSALDVLMN